MRTSFEETQVPRQTGFSFGEHGVAPAAGCVAADHEAAAVHGW